MLADAAHAEDKSVTIGLALYSQLQPRWLFDAKAFQDQAAKNGDTVILQYADGDPTKQTQQVQSMLSRGIDVLVIASADEAVGSNLVSAAKKEGVKTIAYDIGVKGAAPDWMIVRNQDQVGELQMKAALKEKPTGNYALFKGDAGVDLAQASSVVYAKLLENQSGVKVVYNDFIPGFSPATAQRTAEDILTKYNDDVAAFVSVNDGMATGIIQALQGAGKVGKVFVSGLDGNEANLHLIATGAQTMTVYTPIDEMGRLAANASHDLGNGRVPAANSTFKSTAGDVPMNQVDLVAVDKTNVCEFVTKIAPAGWADPAVVFKGSDIQCP